MGFFSKKKNEHSEELQKKIDATKDLIGVIHHSYSSALKTVLEQKKLSEKNMTNKSE